MTVKYGKFELPTTIKVEEASKSATFSRFIAEPFGRGFAHTVGNALRRILFVAIEAPSLVSLTIEGIAHEYTAVEGIVEDMIHIVLNFKGVLLRKLPFEENRDTRLPKQLSKTLDITQEMIDSSGGAFHVTVKEAIDASDFELVNPDHHLFTVTQPMKRRIDVKVAIGRGYVPAERQGLEEVVTNEIVLDSSFSPVRLVNYFVENTRVGQDTDYDRLILEITTDGRILPQEALTFATQIGVLHLNIFNTLKFQDLSFDNEKDELDEDRHALFDKLRYKINELELSVRSANCLELAGVEYIAELVIMEESEMLKFRNFGKKSLREIQEKVEKMGLQLGMDLSRYGVNSSNVREMMREYIREHANKQEVTT